VPATRVRLPLVAALAGLVAVGAGCSEDPPTKDEPEAPRGPAYVAFGDSFTAAPGVPVTETLSGCARSDHNYVAQVASLLAVTVEDASCGGATTLNVTETQVTIAGPVAPQLDALSRDTQLVTVGLGANDQDVYVTLFSTCVAMAATDPQGAPCQAANATSAGGDLLLDEMPTIEERLVGALGQIMERAPDAEVVLVGYPQLVPESGSCSALPLAIGDYAYARRVWAALGTAMADAAERADVTYLDLTGPSEGHDICAGAEAWVNGATGHEARAAAYHPFAEEQAAVAALIAAED